MLFSGWAFFIAAIKAAARASPQVLVRAASQSASVEWESDRPPSSLTEPIIMEVLGGARDEDGEAHLRRLLLRFELLQFDPVADFDGAVRIYRSCRRAGVTPRGMVDCLVASVARRRAATLLSHDVDFERMARVVGIDLDETSSPST